MTFQKIWKAVAVRRGKEYWTKTVTNSPDFPEKTDSRKNQNKI